MKTKIDKRTVLILTATIVLAGVAVFGAWRLYQLRGQAVAPTAPKLVPAQEVASCPAVSFTVGGGCPVANSTCCRQPLITCDNSLQCGTGYGCDFGYCVKQTYDPATNTCPDAPTRTQPIGSGGEGNGGGVGETPAGGTAPVVSPSPSPSPATSPSPSPKVSPSPAAGTSPQPGSSSTSPSSSQTSPSSGSSTSAPAGTAQAQLPKAGISLPAIALGAGGILILVLGILLAF